MKMPKPFLEVVRRGDKAVMQVNANEIATIQPTAAGTTLIVMHNGDRIETESTQRDVDTAISAALTQAR